MYYYNFRMGLCWLTSWVGRSAGLLFWETTFRILLLVYCLLFIVRSKNLLFQKFWIKTKLSQRALLLNVFFFYNFIISNITYIPTWAGRGRRRHDWPFWQRQHWGVASTSAFEQGGSSSTCHKQKLCQSQLLKDITVCCSEIFYFCL